MERRPKPQSLLSPDPDGRRPQEPGQDLRPMGAGTHAFHVYEQARNHACLHALVPIAVRACALPHHTAVNTQ